ncbi:winged helix-turn-helix domain-containing protein [Actinophytocola oryzae]|uniref:ArsR family transcriptional regulator n=1 Tax=Actinophytocola oryzae TaxID=502181 RepID=A0A4R7V5E3_9PSEU|nr:helix-turn-helix domain-containing protein [Actinophytocola oryzae]TDV42736.1 ArsR family transcriptional regulator [Actinophytocola oryzae]
MEHIRLGSRALRVLAHPLRVRLLSQLRLHGPATATVLARRLDTNTGATSYHLRKLAEVELVVETGEGTGKQRFWAAAQDAHSWREVDYEDPDARAAASWLNQEYWQQFVERAVRWQQVRESWPVPWQEAAGMSDVILDLDAAQLTELMAELYEVALRYRDRAPVEGSRQVLLNLFAMPAEPRSLP